MPWSRKKPLVRVTSQGARYVDVEQMMARDDVQKMIREVDNHFSHLEQVGGKGSLNASGTIEPSREEAADLVERPTR